MQTDKMQALLFLICMSTKTEYLMKVEMKVDKKRVIISFDNKQNWFVKMAEFKINGSDVYYVYQLYTFDLVNN